MKKFKRIDRENPKDDPLGIGLSKKTLVLIGVGLVGVIALKIYLDKKKRAAAGVPQPLPAPQGHDPIGLGVPVPPMMNGHTPASTDAPSAPPFGSPSTGTAPASPPPARQPSRANYESPGGFSGRGDGGLNGANSRM